MPNEAPCSSTDACLVLCFGSAMLLTPAVGRHLDSALCRSSSPAHAIVCHTWHFQEGEGAEVNNGQTQVPYTNTNRPVCPSSSGCMRQSTSRCVDGGQDGNKHLVCYLS